MAEAEAARSTDVRSFVRGNLTRSEILSRQSKQGGEEERENCALDLLTRLAWSVQPMVRFQSRVFRWSVRAVP